MKSISKRFKDAFEAALGAYLPPDTRGILIGYSGGADSSALLHLLAEYCDKRGIALKALHVHHGIRGEEADADAAFCARTCESLGVAFLPVYADIPMLAKQKGMGIEETARAFRYEAFVDAVRSDAELSCIVTAHNADDHAETVLHHLARGSGIGGLCGIPPVRMHADIPIIRPLLPFTKSEVLGYCAENGIHYVFDSTNAQTVYTRNFVRAELMPAMRKLNPSVTDAILRMSESLRADSDYLEAQADAAFSQLCDNGTIDAKALSSLHESLASRVLKRMYGELSPQMPETVHVKALLALAKTAEEQAAVSLPDGVRAFIEGGTLHFARGKAESFCFEYPLHMGINRFESPDFAILVAKNDASDGTFEKDNEYLINIYKFAIYTLVNSDKIEYMLYARSKRDGDAYVYGGMTRKLKKLYTDRHLTRSERQRLPVICDDGGILFVPGFQTADRIRADVNDLTIGYYYN